MVQNPLDLADVLSEDDDNNFSPHPVPITSSKYYELEEFLTINSTPQFCQNFSLLSFNIRSIHGKYEEFKDFLSDIPNRFSVIALQEVWSVSCEYPLPGTIQ